MSKNLCVYSASFSNGKSERAAAAMTTTISALAGIGAATAVAISFAQPAEAQDFQSEIDSIFPGICGSGGPGCTSLGAAGGPGGQVAVQGGSFGIGQHMRDLQCEADDNTNCLQPGGAGADTMPFEGLNLFVSGGYQHKYYDGSAEANFDSDRGDITVGLDSPMDWGLIGGAITFNHTAGEFDHDGGNFNEESFGGLLYGSYYPNDSSFIDAVIGLAGKAYDLDRTVVAGGLLFGKAHGDTLGFEFQSSLSGGYDFSFDNFTIGPRLSINYQRTELDDLTESGSPMALRYDEQVEDSLTSKIGFQGSVAISTSFGVVVPQVNAAYVHEFLNDRRTVHATASNGAAVNFVTDPPDRNYFDVGAGVVFVLPDGLSPFLSYSAEVANRFEEVHTVTAGVRLEM